MTRTEYRTATGERLVVQGDRGARPMRRNYDVRASEARRAGKCSVCDAPTPPTALDASGRCVECQP